MLLARLTPGPMGSTFEPGPMRRVSQRGRDWNLSLEALSCVRAYFGHAGGFGCEEDEFWVMVEMWQELQHPA